MARYAEPNATADMLMKLWDKKSLEWAKECGDYDDEDIEQFKAEIEEEAGSVFADPAEIVPEKDMKIIFNFENNSMPWCNNFGDGVDFYQINGTTIALCCAGGDWEQPVYYALYVEKGGKKLRMYIPTVGNRFDGYYKTAFGSEEESECASKVPEELLDENTHWAYQSYIEEHMSVEDMLKDIGARIEGATPCVPFDKKPLKWDKTAKEWAKEWAKENVNDYGNKSNNNDEVDIEAETAHLFTNDEPNEDNNVVVSLSPEKPKFGVTKVELMELIEKTCKQNGRWESPFYVVPETDDRENMKVRFEEENFSVPWEDDGDCYADEIGFYETDENTTVAVCCGGGDWEVPVYYIVYKGMDEKLHMYIPTLGNVFDIYTMTAFGSESEFFFGNLREVMPSAFHDIISDDGEYFSDNADDENNEFNKWQKRIEDSASAEKMIREFGAWAKDDRLDPNEYEYMLYQEDKFKAIPIEKKQPKEELKTEVPHEETCGCGNHGCGCHETKDHECHCNHTSEFTFKGLKDMKREFDRIRNQNKEVTIKLTYDELMELLSMMKSE